MQHQRYQFNSTLRISFQFSEFYKLESILGNLVAASLDRAFVYKAGIPKKIVNVLARLKS